MVRVTHFGTPFLSLGRRFRTARNRRHVVSDSEVDDKVCYSTQMDTKRASSQRRGGAAGHACPAEATVRCIGGRWKVPIVFHLAAAGTLRFGELRKRLSGITQKMLTQQLRELE